MYKKKEIIIISAIIGLTVFLGFLPMIISSCDNKKDDEIVEKEERNDYLSIIIKGELNVDKVNLEIPYGYSYGYIISKIKPYLNQYSIIDKELTKRYYEDSIIIIYSSDINNEIVEEIDNSNLININESPKDDLTKLFGIGTKRADAIIEYREKKKIESFTELKDLLGVSDEVISAIKEKAIL
ncbi:MAG: DUF655 domain-containing protein [Acholeplasmatales bacterium]|nr:DUF655 domain-containing protein [Acholeplasmatales bacterium]